MGMVETDDGFPPKRRWAFAYTQTRLVRTNRLSPEPTPSSPPVKRPLAIVLLPLAAFVAALFLAGPAAATTPCWKTLINDWYDGRIDNVYPVPCYRDALANLPEDVAQYSSLEDDINRALAAAIAAGGGKNGGGGGGSNNSTGSGSGTTASSTFHGGPKAGGMGVGPTTAGRDDGKGPVGQAISSIGPDSASSVPIPLIVLGALAILLLALGTAGVVARRLQTRRSAVRPGANA